MRWSLSSLSTWERCPKKYQLQYLEKIPSIRGKAAERGIDKHKTVELFVKNELDKLPYELSHYHQFLTGIRQYENYPEHKIALTIKWQPTEWEAEDAWYRGVLDLKVISGYYNEESISPEVPTRGSPKEAVVYDWKSGKIYDDHDDQKSLYSVAVFSELPSLQTVRAIHVYLDLGKNREQVFHSNQVHQLREHWISRVGKLERDRDFIPNPGYYCRWCSYSRSNGGPCRF